jgi:deoxyribonuclease IV
MILGAHISINQGLIKGLSWAEEIGAQSIQFFAGNPRGWSIERYPDQEAENFKDQLAKRKLGPVFLHSAYLINLASRQERIWKGSINSLRVSLAKAEQIKARGVVTHIGSLKGLSKEEGLKKVAERIKEILRDGSTNLILENSAGAGEIIGDQLEELAEITERVNSEKIQICLDTCHLFASGYNIAEPEELDKIIGNFDRLIGLRRLALIHLNDSKGKLGSRLDRHLDIGRGEIGLRGFKLIVNHPSLRDRPGIIETPTITRDDQNLRILRKLSDSN